MKIKIELSVPGKTEPGFLRRAKQATVFADRIKKASDGDPKIFDEIVEFLLPYVKVPADRKQAREALWDASEAEFSKALTALSGGSRSTVPPKKAETSKTST